MSIYVLYQVSWFEVALRRMVLEVFLELPKGAARSNGAQVQRWLSHHVQLNGLLSQKAP